MIADRSAASMDELLEELGRDIAALTGYAKEPTKDEYADIARIWLQKNSVRMRGLLCRRDEMRRLFKSEGSVAVAAFIDVLAGASFGVAPATLAYILLKLGYERLCQGNDSREGDPEEKA